MQQTPLIRKTLGTTYSTWNNKRPARKMLLISDNTAQPKDASHIE